MKIKCHLVALMIGLLAASVEADEYSIAVLGEAPPADELSAEIVSALATKGVKVTKGTSRTVCDIWLCKSWEVKADFKATPAVMYPFSPGQLIGVLRFKRRGNDFRDQEIPSGVYTLRYAQQPIDGNHIGTFATRDFLVMVDAASDKSAGPFDVRDLMTASAEAAESNHPGMLCLQKSDDNVKSPALKHNEDHDWWIAQLTGKATVAGKSNDLPIAVVVVGYAAE